MGIAGDVAPVVSPFIVEVANVCRQHADRELLLLCPTATVGCSWLASLQRYAPEIKLPRAVTLLQFAATLAAPDVERQRLALLTPEEIESLVWEIWQELGQTFSPRVQGQVGNGPAGLCTLTATLHELRMAGLDSATLDVTQFVNKERGRALHKLLEAYEQKLRARPAADPATVLLLAQNRLIGEGTLPDGQLLIVPDELEFAGLPQNVLDQVPDVDRVTLPGRSEALPLFSTGERDVNRLRWLGQPQEAPPPAHDGSVQMLRALAPEYEVRAVLGTLFRDQVPFDQAEVIYTDGEMYPRLFAETLAAYLPGQRGLPCTWGDGLPVAWTRPGRALRLWTAWIETEYRAKELIELIVQDLVARSAFNDVDLTRVLPLLRSMPGCLGRDAWRQRIRAKVQWHEAESSDSAWPALQQLTDPLFELLPATPPSAADVWTATEAFLTRFVAVHDESDRTARDQALRLIRTLRPAYGAPPETVADRLLAWIDESRLNPEGPQPGKLHLAPLTVGGYTGRPVTFIVGMNEDAFPGHVEWDSFLTDRDRRQLSPELARTTRPERQEHLGRRFQHILDHLPGKVVFTYPCANQVEDCEVFPSQKLIEIFRLLSRQPNGDLYDFERWLPPPIGPTSPLVQMHIQDCWVQTWPMKGLYDPVVKQRFPHLPRGAFAARERRQVQFTRYDGHVPRAGECYDVRKQQPVFSAGALQRLARCPLQFFLANMLDLTERGQFEAGEWLNPLLRGEVLHNVFRDYHHILQRHKRKANPARDTFIVRQLLDEELKTRSPRLPVVPEHVRHLEVNELQDVLMMFVSEEARLADEYEPLYFEASLGMAADGEHATALDTDQPIVITLPSGRTLWVRGRLDRVDRLKSAGSCPRFFVWDYKTGGISSFMGDEARRSGQVLQPLLYLEMLEQRLRAIVDPEATVAGVGYFFPGQRGQGDRLAWSAEQLREHSRALDLLLDLLEAGTFLATERRDVCSTCGYQAACDLSLVNDQARHKRSSTRNAELLPLRMLRDPNVRAEVADVG